MSDTPEGVEERHLADAPEDNDVLPAAGPDAKRLRTRIMIGVFALLLGVVALYLRAASRTNYEALSQAPRPVSTVKAEAASYRPLREYVGTIEPWNAARVGPQFISAYVGAVLVRPGAVVTRGEVLATLDCRNASAASKEIAAQAKALEEQQTAVEHEAQRTSELKQGGFASENEIEQLQSRSASDKAKVESLRASLVSRTLEVNDCVLRAPFNGEVSERFVDPGAYVRPGEPIVHVVDRNIVRITADAPEEDFGVVTPGTAVRIEVPATGAKLEGKIARRSPAADETTRTVHFEIDLVDAKRAIPVGTTARLTIEVGQPQSAIRVPLRAATLRGTNATLFIVAGDKAKRVTVPVLGERGGSLLVQDKIAAGTPVVIEGRALLDDGDRVQAKEQAVQP
jgi:RND family efflux transporter MFP subunit